MRAKLPYKMPSPPEEALLPFCEANEEWCELREKEFKAWLMCQEEEKPLHGCEPADMMSLRRLGKEVRWREAVADRVYAQAKLRKDRLRSHANINEQ